MHALVSKKDNGRVCEVVADDEMFETHTDMVWIDCTGTDIENEQPAASNGGTWTYSFETETFSIVPPFTDPAERFSIARRIGYGQLGNQLDMLYKELKSKGSITTDGEWFAHVKKVKEDITHDNT